MICLGIESTAHTFGVGIANSSGKVLANVLKPVVTKKGGIIPAEASDHHVKVCDEAIKEALAAAKFKLSDVGLIAFAQGPGIGHCLRVGAMAARSLSLLHKLPLVGVNHCIAHLEIGKLLTAAKEPVLLYVSGANTQVIAFESGKYRVFGETLDIGVGNMLDVFGREIGFGFPAGPKIMETAAKGKKYVEIPYVIKGMDVSFGGILTNVSEKARSGKYSKADLCYSLQETVFAMLVEAAERAMAHTGKKELLLGGGVASNIRLQEMCRIMCRERNAKMFVPERQFLVDNGAMIAWLGILEHKKGKQTKIKDSGIKPYWRTDEA
ncbi:bifunctional N(6)-L-threonylcarbamoyladenine synthase/serine/threonine protein kinase [Candidatus Woesearchaeota archaeon]|nr:bifunctional N(6)-L-threonylcarbamoyladenine synthase/serine/threonine protein kinase [Candidatus Woesearchaeota archaeon]